MAYQRGQLCVRPRRCREAHHQHPLAAIWGDGTDSSSDGQHFRAGACAGPSGDVIAKYGINPGTVLYTTQSGQYGPMHVQPISATASEAPYVLDGLHPHAHRTRLRIAEHYTDTGGATDHVFGLCHVLGYATLRYASRRAAHQGSVGAQALYRT